MIGEYMAIDRQKLVSRHNPILNSPDQRSPLSVGNGEFAFTADITGLQTFMRDYSLVPLCTMAQWGWHSFPVDMDEKRLQLTPFDTYGREVGYAAYSEGQQELYDNLRQNAHRLNLASIGLNIESNGYKAKLTDIKSALQTLDLWRGLLKSRFEILGREVEVETCVDPEQDAIGVRISSKLINSGDISVKISFPYGSPGKSASDWDHPERHKSEIILNYAGRTIIKRSLDKDIYYADIAFHPSAALKHEDPHTFLLSGKGNDNQLAFTCRFSSKQAETAPYSFIEAKQRAADWWEHYWNTGGVIQLANSKDPRAFELERRIILSQYLTAIQCSGTLPPAETGLTCNSWYGKFHLEMHYWHAAHFPLWGRAEMLERSLQWYLDILPSAREIAAKQGYTGARWPKMCDASGRNSPSWISVFLIWQQPHPIMLAELCYRANPSIDILKKYRKLVIESAEFMTSYAHFDSINDRYVLGPPLIPAQETHKPDESLNPSFELEYFRSGLETANKWINRLGEQPSEQFSEVARKLSALPVKDGVYLAHENCPNTFTAAPFNHDHPSMLSALGVLPGAYVDRNTMRNTVNKVLECWDFKSMWGWDFPMMAMCCAKLGMTSLAVDLLLMDTPKNTWLLNGHNPQGDSEDLPLYLPGNGGLLLATGMMTAGWDGNNRINAPGFPQDGNWVVEFEGLNKYI